MIEMPSLVYKTHSLLSADSRLSVSKSHVREVAAAMLGYGTYAAYQVDAQAGVDLSGVDHIVLQPAQAEQRAKKLGMADAVAKEVTSLVSLNLIKAYSPAQGSPLIHPSVEDFRDNLLWEQLRDSVSDSDEVATAFAGTNAYDDYGPDLDEITWQHELLASRDDWSVEGTGSITGSQDPDRAYSGNVIDFSITRRFEIVGRVGLVFLEDDVGAAVRDDWRGDDDE